MRILVADDDATSRLLLNTIATRQGHECVHAADGSQAWDLLLSEDIEVLLTDWMMPGLDGPQLCRRVREEITGRYVYIVLITGLSDRQQILEGMSAGADDYLVKPVDPFAVQTRLVAAERVTVLHQQVSHFRTELERVNSQLLRLSLTDALTGLGNRRQMEQDLAQTHDWAERGRRNYAVALFDVDHFKLYNDYYGHLAGDEALRTIGHALKMNIRAVDRAYRFGGEEFLVLMPDCALDQAAVVANRVNRAVLGMALAHERRSDDPRIVTVSAGVAGWHPDSPLLATDLISRADSALYEAKAAGRNRVAVDTRGTTDGELVALRNAGAG